MRLSSEDTRRVREGLGLSHAAMAALLGVSIRKVFYLEARGVQGGPTGLVYDLARKGDLPWRYVDAAEAATQIQPVEG